MNNNICTVLGACTLYARYNNNFEPSDEKKRCLSIMYHTGTYVPELELDVE